MATTATVRAEFRSPKYMFGAIVQNEGAACPGVLEPVLTRVAILLSTIGVCCLLPMSLEFDAAILTGSSG